MRHGLSAILLLLLLQSMTLTAKAQKNNPVTSLTPSNQSTSTTELLEPTLLFAHIAKEQWLYLQTLSLSTAYDDNLNYAPDRSGLAAFETGLFNAGWELDAIHLYEDDLSLKLNLGLDHQGVFRNQALKSTRAFTNVDVAKAWNNSLITGIEVGFNRHQQKDVLDQREVILASDYSFWEYQVSPHFSYDLNETMRINFTHLWQVFNYEDTNRVNRAEYDSTSHSTNLDWQWHQQDWEVHLGHDYLYESFDKLPAVALTGLPSPTKQEKTKTHHTYLSILKPIDLVTPYLSLHYTKKSDDFEGAEDYRSYAVQSKLFIEWPRQLPQVTIFFASYEKQDYQKRSTVNQTANRLDHRIIEIGIEHQLAVSKNLHISMVASQTKRISNESVSQFDRGYRKRYLQLAFDYLY